MTKITLTCLEKHWLRIDYRRHPSYPAKSVTEIEEEIFMASIAHGALVMRGSWFYADADAPHDSLFFRATYAAAPAEKIDEAIRLFGVAVRNCFGLVGADGQSGGAVSNGVGNGHH